MTDKIVVLVTCASESEARKIARALVDARLAACVNVLLWPVRSIYRWKGKVEETRERLLIIKSARKHFAALQKEITRLHSYDVPEIIALPVTASSREYLAWLDESLAPAGSEGKEGKRK